MEQVTLNLPFQTSFQISTNSKELVGMLKLKYGKYVTTTAAENAKHISAFKKDGVYQVAFEDTNVTDESGAFAIDEIVANNTVYDEAVFALHGAAVEHRGKAYLFLASTTSGKSTLTSFLTTSGFGYLTDDCILLDRTSFCVYPFTTPIHLREGGLNVLKRLNSAPKSFEVIDDEKFERFVYTPSNCVTRPAELDKIFFIARTEQENSLNQMDTISRMTALMKAPITPYPVTPDYLKFISKLAAKNCFALNYCDMAFAAEVIQNG